MASTLLAVDDSVTMRKVLEITFASPDFRVVTANSPDAALQKLKGDKPDLVITDLSLEPMNGYDLCKAIKKASPVHPRARSCRRSRTPSTPPRASAAQADDHMDKPFDTQQMIDKVKKLLAGTGRRPCRRRRAQGRRRPRADDALDAGSPASAPPAARPALSPQPRRCRPAAAAAAAGSGGAPPQRAKTLIYNPPPAGGGPAAAAFPARPAPAGPTPASRPPDDPAQARGGGRHRRCLRCRPNAARPRCGGARAPPATTVAAAHVNGQMAAKLGDSSGSPPPRSTPSSPSRARSSSAWCGRWSPSSPRRSSRKSSPA